MPDGPDRTVPPDGPDPVAPEGIDRVVPGGLDRVVPAQSGRVTPGDPAHARPAGRDPATPDGTGTGTDPVSADRAAPEPSDGTGTDPGTGAGTATGAAPATPDARAPSTPPNGRPGHRRDPLRVRRRTIVGTLLGVLVLSLAVGLGLAGGTRGPGPHSGGPAAVPPSTALPFDLPDTRALRSGPHLVFAHYFPPYPLSLDNQPADRDYYTRNYLTPGGEGGKHAAYGGLLRDRPPPVAPSSGDWRLTNMEREVRTARDAGLDGFSVDILALTGTNADRVGTLLRAAHAVDPGFKIMLMPDMTALRSSADATADALARWAAAPSSYHLADGRLVVSPFKAEAHTPDWWRQVTDRLAKQHGIRTALVPLFLNYRAHAQEFSAISYGFSAWGNRSHTGQNAVPGDVRLAHGLGKKWMQPVAVQDARPNQAIYDEAGNTALLRSTWQHAIQDGADWVQLTTWNDYSETSQVAPSLHNGHAYLDLCSYYLTRFKTGKWPAIVRDVVYLTSRVQFAGTAKAAHQTRLMRPRTGTATPRDDVEALTFLTAPATVDMTIGTARSQASVPAGVRATLQPLRIGLSTATVHRAGHTVATATTRWPVRDHVDVQDLQYYAVTSGRPEESGKP